jgi:hypothetical protein
VLFIFIFYILVLFCFATTLTILGAFAALAAQFALASAFVALIKWHEASFAKFYVHIFFWLVPLSLPRRGRG